MDTAMTNHLKRKESDPAIRSHAIFLLKGKRDKRAMAFLPLTTESLLGAIFLIPLLAAAEGGQTTHHLGQ